MEKGMWGFRWPNVSGTNGVRAGPASICGKSHDRIFQDIDRLRMHRRQLRVGGMDKREFGRELWCHQPCGPRPKRVRRLKRRGLRHESIAETVCHQFAREIDTVDFECHVQPKSVLDRGLLDQETVEMRMGG